MDLITLKKYCVRYNWSTVYYGVKYAFFKEQVISDYAYEQLESGNNEEYVTELAWGDKNDDLHEQMELIYDKVIKNEDSSNEDVELRYLRYAFCCNLNELIKDKDKLLESLSILYSRLNYPEDMSSFITYMPQVIVDKNLSPYDNLLNNFRNFLDTEKKEMKI